MSIASTATRKIVHIDMDAFYASVEQRDRAELRGRPVIVAWRGPRSVVCAASYEARRFGVHSAMPAARAERLCPQAEFLAPDFTKYRAVSKQIREIFRRYTDLVEPLSLDEAYLDVTSNKLAIPSATEVAASIRRDIRAETDLTASAGVAPNKFLAKIASDWQKPDGQFVIRPREIVAFLAPLPVGKIPGVGRSTQAKLAKLGIETVADLRRHDAEFLARQFGRFGRRLSELSWGKDENPVRPNRPVKSISAETTFEQDVLLNQLEATIRKVAARVWAAAAKSERRGRTVVVKLKTSDFKTLTRSSTLPTPPESCDELVSVALGLLQRVDRPATQRYRLAGVGLANFADHDSGSEQQSLFDEMAGSVPAAKETEV